jgi:multidrug efflux pump
MDLPKLFLRRPVATTLLTLGVALAGAIAFFLLPIAPLPQVDFPAIVVQAWLAGASPEIMSTSIAAPLERHLGQIADVTAMTSSSYRGYTEIRLIFGLDRSINGAARDVEAAINAARADLPTTLKRNPTYYKVNPAEAPILILGLISTTRSAGQLYDAASIFQQKLSQVQGIGLAQIEGSSKPAVRIELNPNALFHYGIGLEDVRAALAAANANAPKGAIESNGRRYQIYTNDQARDAAQYRSLVIASRDGSVVRLSDVGDAVDSVEDLRNQGLANGKPAVLVILYRQPGANIVDTSDRVKALLPRLRASVPADIDVAVTSDRTITIRAALHEVETTLLISIGLVILVVFLFLRRATAALIPSVAIPVSLLGTFGGMYLLGYSLDNLSLMALTIATGFVVDDAIVVLENITRHREAGVPRFAAATRGAAEVAFTVLAMSTSLIAVFIPILLMGGLVGRMFREFAVTLSIAIAISLVVSLTATPVMCASLTRRDAGAPPGRLARLAENGYRSVLGLYERTLVWALAHARLTMLVLIAILGLNLYLFAIVPKGFFPHQDTGRLVGWVEPDQSASFALMRGKLTALLSVVRKNPAVDSVAGYAWGFVMVSLKPLADRKVSADEVIAALRTELAKVPGATLRLRVAQDINIGAQAGHAQYQYTVLADNLGELTTWMPRIVKALQHLPEIDDADLDENNAGLADNLDVDRETATRLGLSLSQIDNTLYDAFGQRQVSTIYDPLNQYHVVMELAPRYWASPEALREIYVSTGAGPVSGTNGSNAVVGTVSDPPRRSGPSRIEPAAAEFAADTARNQRSNQLGNAGRERVSTGEAVSTGVETMVPLAAFSRFEIGTTPFGIDHRGPFVADTISFNLAPGKSLSDAVAAIDRAMSRMNLPAGIHGSYRGTARVFEQSVANEPVLILAALVTVYIVLGFLYESYVHPLTILSTLPSAGVGSVLALMAFQTEFSLVALIGLILLIGIVQKNAIMMIDFALHAERSQGLSSREAIYQACLLRFRPIMMTTMAALLGTLPLMLAGGAGAELRRPLGISVAGGLIVSQLLTLYTTPVVYLYFDRFRAGRRNR